MTYLEQALISPKLHFKQLRNMEPALRNGRPALRRTYGIAECEISLEGKRYMLYMPFKPHVADIVEALEQKLLPLSATFICHNRILRNEFEYINLFGRRSVSDIIIQPIPDGIPFREALSIYSPPTMFYALKALKRDMESIGFSHNNLSPSNIIVSKGGELHLLRYWYAEIGEHCNDNFSTLEEMVHSSCMYKTKPAPATESSNRLHRRYVNNLFGFDDSSGKCVIPYIYSWADDFKEERAIVAQRNLMGVIDPSGRVIIPIEYDDIEFNRRNNAFIGYRDNKQYILSFNGEDIGE